MRNVPWWGVVSSAVAPVLLVGGGTVATRLQPPSFDPVADTVSALAAAERGVGLAQASQVTVMPSAVAVALFAAIATGSVAKRAFGRKDAE